MSKPATDMRLQRAAEGFTEVIGRGDAHIITKNPTTGKYAYDGQVGAGWHYGAGLETDTAWMPGVAPWDWQMVKANYNVFALSQFNNGQIIKYVDPASGQSVTFQPMALQWTNSLNQIQQISMPQSVVAQASDDVLYWPAAYGTGRNFKYQACPSRLSKQLIIDSPSALPATSYDTLALNFIISVSSGVNIMVNGQTWDKKTQKDTTQSIAFQLPGGAVLWSFAVPTAYDSSGDPETGFTTGSMRLKKQGNSLYVSVRFPKSWIDSAVFPVVLDPTVEYTLAASGDDALLYEYNSQFLSTYQYEIWGQDSNGWKHHNYMRFLDVTIPVGASITTSRLEFYFYDNSGAGTITANIYCEKAANPGAKTTYAGAMTATKTTNRVGVNRGSNGPWWNTDSLNSVLQELVDAYDYSAGAPVNVFIIASSVAGSGHQFTRSRGWDYDSGTSSPILHIEYTEAAGGDPEGSLIGCKLLRGGLLLHGVLGR